jgi:uncharacterized protein (DUF2235 family)
VFRNNLGAGRSFGRSAEASPMKRIVICCDGTWQRLDGARPTNVVTLAKLVLPEAPDGTVQLAFHLDGVGTGRGTGAVARQIDRFLGGAMGFGLTEAVAEAYRLLVFAYKPGDEIYIVGYSRGAYTARSLAGMIRNCGIIERGCAERIGEALALYRSTRPEDHPDGEASLAFRADCAPAVVTSDGELAWRRRERPERDWSGVLPLRVRYVGVWDTVGSLGVPSGWSIARLLNRRHQFHDTMLSSRVEAARHAVAIDERRRNFAPALWDNVAELNAPGGSGPEAAYQQRWFPGVHGAVGGGGEERLLSNGTLLWVLEGAERQGLAVDPALKAAVAASVNPVAGRLDAGQPRVTLAGVLLQLGPVDREGPADGDGLSTAAVARWRGDPSYRPRPLEPVRPLLDGTA